MTSCSKGAWGLFVLSREIGILTDTAISPSTWSRQCPSRYAIRAGRNLPDKEFRYLRTVIVTAAVYRGFGSDLRPVFTELSPPLNLPAPGRRQCVYGAFRGLARTCVFAKQSLGPISCGRTQLGCTPHQVRHPFFRSYGAIMPSSLTTTHSCTLGFSPRLPVSVCGTDASAAPRSTFLACRLQTTWAGVAPCPRIPLSACAYSVRRPIHMAARPLFHGPRPLQHNASGAGMLTGFPSPTPLGPRLRTRLTLR
jgi:hypothetical protein